MSDVGDDHDVPTLDDHDVPTLDEVEVRVLGALIEKERATPQNYPLTLNALRTACNQATNREPVVDYDDHTVEAALARLRERHLTRIVYSTSNRAAKFRHVLDEVLHLGGDEMSVLCVLFLRGPQTIGEIKGRTERLHPFADLGEVQEVLDRMATRSRGALVRRLDRRPGQKDARYTHLLGVAAPVDTHTTASVAGTAVPPAPVAPAAVDTHTAIADVTSDPSTARSGGFVHGAPGAPASPSTDVAELAADVARLRDEVAALRSELDELRSLFD